MRDESGEEDRRDMCERDEGHVWLAFLIAPSILFDEQNDREKRLILH